MLIQTAKNALDKVIVKSRIHFYKPIQIAEILYHYRIYKDINLNDLESYRSKSKFWRDKISIELLGRVCTSSAKFQDDLFNAITPNLIAILGEYNNKHNGIVESYIYERFLGKYTQLSNALNYCLKSNKNNFQVKEFIDLFWYEAGLRRSIDKVYEIIVYALFDTLATQLELNINISINKDKVTLLNEFSDFVNCVMQLNKENLSLNYPAKIYRVGVTNAADRGLDMYANWGVAIQIKHLSLNEHLAHNIVSSISSDRIIIVCKDAEQKIIVSLLTQIGWKSKIQSIIVETDLIAWYEKALRGKYASELGDNLLETLRLEIMQEFPSTKKIPEALIQRNYQNLKKDNIFNCKINDDK